MQHLGAMAVAMRRKVLTVYPSANVRQEYDGMRFFPPPRHSGGRVAAALMGGLRCRWGLSVPKLPRILAEQNFHAERSSGTGREADGRQRNDGLPRRGQTVSVIQP